MITKRCIICGTEQEVNVTCQEIRLWNCGMHICEAMPNLTSGEKRLFISGMCGRCFEEISVEEEEVAENALKD